MCLRISDTPAAGTWPYSDRIVTRYSLALLFECLINPTIADSADYVKSHYILAVNDITAYLVLVVLFPTVPSMPYTAKYVKLAYRLAVSQLRNLLAIAEP